MVTQYEKKRPQLIRKKVGNLWKKKIIIIKSSYDTKKMAEKVTTRHSVSCVETFHVFERK